ETVILRVGHLRECEYELQQHRRLARSRGLNAEVQARIFEGPDADGLTDRQRVLITATDEFVVTRGVSAQTWQALAGHFTKPQLIEFCLLAAQYDGLAATISTLGVPLDFPD
ncbi:MAG: carboxymuconolactone decarboxylase family protein, partial [Mycobacterium sp.]